MLYIESFFIIPQSLNNQSFYLVRLLAVLLVALGRVLHRLALQLAALAELAFGAVQHLALPLEQALLLAALQELALAAVHRLARLAELGEACRLAAMGVHLPQRVEELELFLLQSV